MRISKVLVFDSNRGRTDRRMTTRIGFVGSDGSDELCEAVSPLIPPGTTLEALGVSEAMRLVADGELMVLIIAVDGPSWAEGLQRVVELQAICEARPLAVLALVMPVLGIGFARFLKNI